MAKFSRCAALTLAAFALTIPAHALAQPQSGGMIYFNGPHATLEACLQQQTIWEEKMQANIVRRCFQRDTDHTFWFVHN